MKSSARRTFWTVTDVLWRPGLFLSSTYALSMSEALHHVWQGYIHKFLVILHDNLQHESDNPRSSHVCHVIAATTWSDEYWHLHRYGCRNTLIYAHKTSHILPTCDISPFSLTLPVSEAGDFLELFLLYTPISVTVHVLRTPAITDDGFPPLWLISYPKN